jgi:hypothetical protein
MEPDLARFTQARKIAAITLTLWKKGECFSAEHHLSVRQVDANRTWVSVRL